MKLLLDTHVLLWALSTPETLSSTERNAIKDGANVVFASVASLWEIGIKQSLGKLNLPAPAGEWLPPLLTSSGFDTLSISPRHAFAASSLPAHHRDPFDRMLVAQAMTEDLTLVTRDHALKRYGAATFDR